MMSKVLELVDGMETELNSKEHQLLREIYGMPETHKTILTLTKIIRLQHQGLIDCDNESCRHLQIRLNENTELTRDFCGDCNHWVYRGEKSTARQALEETNRIAGGGSDE